ncbi:hypothetical protein BP00DRAFT_42440 [Aspergillus indologenus CBS 114.80]|uniref:Uncharacterized protein n=1 Tax=Aspergillus indologenus CBS 114.80 TaxID=1450541 RepID=A0A2V5J8X6_9EURO|nr:hypothetical protein BP00DRAFT_42440 [Aspergillus indologenus CBS 114.80]
MYSTKYCAYETVWTMVHDVVLYMYCACIGYGLRTYRGIGMQEVGVGQRNSWELDSFAMVQLAGSS